MKSQLPNRGNEEFKTWLQSCAKKWNSMTEEQKRPYIEEMKDNFKEYQLKMDAWEKEMIKQGNLDLVRQDALLDPHDPKLKKTTKKPTEHKEKTLKMDKKQQEIGCPNPEQSGISTISNENYIKQETIHDKKVSDQGGGTGDQIQVNHNKNSDQDLKEKSSSEQNDQIKVNQDEDNIKKNSDQDLKSSSEENLFGKFKKLFKF